jgi:DNA-binding NarL/FixJ family response regulator
MVDKARVDRIVAERRAAIKDDSRRILALYPTTRKERYCATLSPAEVGVLRLVGVGLSNQEIAECLFLSLNTVRDHLKKIHDKCEIEGRARLAIAVTKAEE